jgi:hypothetical protein
VEPTKYAVCVVLGTTRLDVNQHELLKLPNVKVIEGLARPKE